MANDAQSQTIPSWVEDDSFEVQSKVTYTINSGHPSPLSATQFKTFWKGLYDNAVVRSGKIQDNTHMNGKYLVDNQRGHNGESNFSGTLNITGETNVDGGQMVVYPVITGGESDDTVTIDWDGVCWIGNSGLDVYSHPFVFKNGSTVVSSTGDFDTVEKITSWRYASDYRKAICNEVNKSSRTTRSDKIIASSKLYPFQGIKATWIFLPRANSPLLVAYPSHKTCPLETLSPLETIDFKFTQVP